MWYAKVNKGVVLATICAGLALSDGIAEVIYQDNFDGSSADALNGTAPDERPGSETWTAAAFFKDNGSYSVSGGSSANATAILPVSIEAGKTYTISVDVDMASWDSTGNWTGLAFWNNTGGTGNAPTVTGNSPAALGLNAAGGLKAYHTGANLVGQGTGYGQSQTLRIKLITYADATPWEAEYYAGDTQLWSHEFSSNPTVTRVVIGTGGTGTELSGTFDNFSLTVIPEPATFGLFGLVLMVALTLRRLSV